MKKEYSVLGCTDIPCMEIFAFPHIGNLRGNPRTEKKEHTKTKHREIFAFPHIGNLRGDRRTEKKEHTKTKQNRRTSIETVSISVIDPRFIYAVK